MSCTGHKKSRSHRRAKRRNSRGIITTYQRRATSPDETITISDEPTKLYLDIVKYRAKRDNIPYAVSDEYLKKLYVDQNKRCAISGLKILFYTGKTPQASRPRVKALTTASLDRINSNNGYVEGNVRWVHKEYNMLKCNLSDEKLLEMCHNVVIHNLRKKIFESYNASRSTH
jgi:hypothetical protein